MKYLRNERGSIAFTVCFVLAMMIFMVILMTWVSVEVTCINIKNNVKNELTNVAIRISGDTYKAMREGNLDEYYKTLTKDSSYKTELENLVKDKITSAMPMETDRYRIENVKLTFEENGDNVEYILTCDVEFYVSLFDGGMAIRKDSIELNGKHNMKRY